MAMPPQFAKKSGGADGKAEEGGEGPKVHLDALESLAKTPRARAAINTLRSELVGDGSQDKGSKRGAQDKTKADALARFKQAA